MLFITFLLLVRGHCTFLIKQKKLYFPDLLFIIVWSNSDKSYFPLRKMESHLQTELSNEPISKLMQVTGRSMWLWFTVNTKVKSRGHFFKRKRKLPSYDTWVSCSTSEVSEQLVVSRPRTAFKIAVLQKQHFVSSFYLSVLCCWYYKTDFFLFQYFTWCMDIPKGSD